VCEREKMKKMITIVVSAAAAATASAQPLNLVTGTPDVASGFIAVDYNATTGAFSATGFTQNLNLPPNQIAMGQRQFSLTAIINNSGQIAGLGSLIVRGDYGGTDQVLFSSNSITAFGFGPTNKFEFIFAQQGGSLAAVGTSIGTILVDPNLVFPGGIPSFSSSFSGRLFPGGPGAANADTFVIPSPSALALAGFGGLIAARRRR
jgi:hypothetical protein